jgi:hypothetical protein
VRLYAVNYVKCSVIRFGKAIYAISLRMSDDSIVSYKGSTMRASGVWRYLRRRRISSPAADATLLHPTERGDLGQVMPSLMSMMPYSRASATRQMRPMSRL